MLEMKFSQIEPPIKLEEGYALSGYASRFGVADEGGDTLAPGAFAASLQALEARGRQVKFLWQHDPAQPIGIWDEVREDETGLFVKGRILTSLQRGREAADLIEAGAIDGLSIGYRTRRAQKSADGGRVLVELDLWEVSLVTFPMLPTARVAQKTDALPPDFLSLGHALRQARMALKGKDISQ